MNEQLNEADTCELESPIIENNFLNEVISGLQQAQKTLPCKYFYDSKGSEIFEKICDSEEYYLTRTELALLATIATDVAHIVGENSCIIEPGSGAGKKVQLLLEALTTPSAFVPLEISQKALDYTGEAINKTFPSLNVYPLKGDFTNTRDVHRLSEAVSQFSNRLVFFPGSTVGNFEPDQAVAILTHFAELAGDSGHLLVGVDLVKDKQVLINAYDDKQGITAAFNKNILSHINGSLNADFKPNDFTHKAIYNEQKARIEMHLVANHSQSVTINGQEIRFASGETIHTENSHKYTHESFLSLAQRSGLKLVRKWQDEQFPFALFLLTPDPS